MAKIDNKLTITLPAFDMLTVLTTVKLAVESYPNGVFADNEVLNSIITQIADQMTEDIRNEIDAEYLMHEMMQNRKN